jgi:hypothetical protein
MHRQVIEITPRLRNFTIVDTLSDVTHNLATGGNQHSAARHDLSIERLVPSVKIRDSNADGLT